MSIQIGDIDIIEQGLNNEFKVERLAMVIDLIIKRLDIKITNEDLNEINNIVLNSLQKKYPNSGLQIVESENTK